MTWDHGYHSGRVYIASSFREVAPNWLDFAAAVKGHPPVRPREGAPFRYLELGSGMGLGLCLLAAAYPEGQFLGVDFHPAHIAHATRLAEQLELANVRFLEADFLELQADPSALQPGTHHYVVAHGIATWVPEPVQRALLALAATLLRPGGLFYCSYNTYPGWLGHSTFQMLLGLELRRGDASRPLEAFERTLAALHEMLGPPESPRLLGRSLPNLSTQLPQLSAKVELSYLLGDYGSQAWQPLYVAEWHQRAMAHKLSFVASATLPELCDGFLSEAVRPRVQAETDPLLREALQDLAINQFFRRDVFSRGHHPLPGPQREAVLAEQRLALVNRDPSDFLIPTSLGDLQADRERCAAIEALLDGGPLSLGEIGQALGVGLETLLPLVLLLLHAGRVVLERGAALEAATTSCRSVNRRLIDLMLSGSGYEFLAAPAAGTGAPLSRLDLLLLEGARQGLTEETLLGWVLMGMAATGSRLLDAEGRELEEPQQVMDALAQRAEQFERSTRPRLVALGLLDGAPQPNTAPG